MKRTILAFAVAPLPAAIVAAPSAGLVFSMALSYGVSYVFGIPAFLILRYFQQEWHLCYAAVGFLLGVLDTLLTITGHSDPGDALILALMFGAVGLAVGLCFSLIRGGERRRARRVR